MQDESDARAEVAAARVATERAIVPGFWWYEIRNILLLNERRGRITGAESEKVLRSVGSLPEVSFPQDSGEVIQLARKHRLSVYDAAYLALAKSEKLELATLDNDLAKAARAEGIALVGSN